MTSFDQANAQAETGWAKCLYAAELWLAPWAEHPTGGFFNRKSKIHVSFFPSARITFLNQDHPVFQIKGRMYDRNTELGP
jgi:hypothetical protein